MNELGRDALRAAALGGVRQIRGKLRDTAGGRCAWGVLEDAACRQTTEPYRWYGMRGRTRHRCPLCRSGRSARLEVMLILHLNDEHACDFLKIAELMPVTDAGA